jgi:tripartite-type tricarboxylate transporter receptor subunit TctC
MKKSLSVKLLVAMMGALVGFSCMIASAQTYPTKTVKIVAPVAPGGGVDLVARTMAERLTRSFNQPFVVENQSGGGGAIASGMVAKSAADGYTLMLGYVATHGTSPAVRKLPYDAVKDFTPIAMVGGTPNVLVVNSSLGVNDLKGFLEYAKKRPGQLSYGSSGLGSLTHLAIEQLKLSAGFFAVHVPYRGIGPAFTDLIGGQTQIMMPGLAAALPHIRSGKLKAIAITGNVRHRLAPDVPTLTELGFKGFDGVQWYGIVGPAKMPEAIVKKLNEEINKAIQSSELKERFSGEALEVMPMTSDQMGTYIKNDIARWTKLAKERNIEVD